MAKVDFLVMTQAEYEGTFTGLALARDNSAMRIVARDVATGFPTRYAARKWAAKCSKAQRATVTVA